MTTGIAALITQLCSLPRQNRRRLGAEAAFTFAAAADTAARGSTGAAVSNSVTNNHTWRPLSVVDVETKSRRYRRVPSVTGR